MIRVRAKGSAAIVFNTISGTGSYPAVAFRGMPRLRTIALLNILPSWSNSAGFNENAGFSSSSSLTARQIHHVFSAAWGPDVVLCASNVCSAMVLRPECLALWQLAEL